MSKASCKYQIIKQDIIQAIKNKELKQEDQIDSELQLCQTYHVSRITVSKALNELVSEGYLYRVQGKGTFVKGRQISEGVIRLSGFSERMKELGKTLTTQVLTIQSVKAPDKMVSFFQLQEDTNVILLKRLRYVDGKKLCISISYFMPDKFYWIPLENMEQESVYDLLENKYKFKLGKAVQEFEVGYLKEKDAKALGISTKDACLKLTLYSYLSDGQPAQYEETYYIENKYVYRIYLNR